MVCGLYFKQKTAYEMRISDWSSDVCSSDLVAQDGGARSRRDVLRPARGAAIVGHAVLLVEHRRRVAAAGRAGDGHALGAPVEERRDVAQHGRLLTGQQPVPTSSGDLHAASLAPEP